MTGCETYRLLEEAALGQAVERNLGRDPLEIALDKNVPHARLVATQVKYLRRARTKLPSYYAARCILPPRAFEQSSGEACAAHKSIGGESVLDLTCGLGVDSLYLSRRFRRVVALERDEELAAVARTNFARLGARNIEVVCTDAADYLGRTDERFDWIVADPDRRPGGDRRSIVLGDCSPDMEALLPLVRRRAPRLLLKLSPLFDPDRALHLFPASRVEAVSAGGECKEVIVYDDGTGPSIGAAVLGRGVYRLPADRARAPLAPCGPFLPQSYRYLIIPDAALRCTRLARRHLLGKAWIGSDAGYGFASAYPDDILGRIFEIVSIERYDPRALRRRWGGHGCTIYKQDFPQPAARIAAQTGIRQGAEASLAFTSADGCLWSVLLGREYETGGGKEAAER